MWFFPFIFGAAIPPLYVTINSNIDYVINYKNFSSEANIVTIKIIMITIIAHLIVTPLVAWLGITLGNNYRIRKAA